MEPLRPDDPPAVGSFRLRARLGAGGMGRVYLAASPAGPSLAAAVETRGAFPEPSLWRLAAGLIEALEAVHAARASCTGISSPRTSCSPWTGRASSTSVSPAAGRHVTHRQSGAHRSALPRSCPRSRPRGPAAPRRRTSSRSVSVAGLRGDRERGPSDRGRLPRGACTASSTRRPISRACRRNCASSIRTLPGQGPRGAAVPGRPGRGGGRATGPRPGDGPLGPFWPETLDGLVRAHAAEVAAAAGTAPSAAGAET